MALSDAAKRLFTQPAWFERIMLPFAAVVLGIFLPVLVMLYTYGIYPAMLVLMTICLLAMLLYWNYRVRKRGWNWVYIIFGIALLFGAFGSVIVRMGAQPVS